VDRAVMKGHATMNKTPYILLVTAACCTLAALAVQANKSQQPAQRERKGPEVIIKDAVTGAAGNEAYWKRMEENAPIRATARKLIAKGEYAEGEKLLRSAVSHAPRDTEAMLFLADAYEHDGKAAEALHTWHTLVDPRTGGGSISSNPNTHFRYVLALVRSGNVRDAAKLYNDTLDASYQNMGNRITNFKFDPSTGDTVTLEAAAHLGLGLAYQSFAPNVFGPDDQIMHLHEAVRLKPRWLMAQYSYGRALQNAGQRTAAMACFKKAAALGDAEITVKAEAARKELAQLPH
jgi:tetratricopeptide (TPR) repeat protein